MELGELPNVTIQIVPFSVGQYEALRMGGISLMTHPWVPGLSVYFKRYEGAILVDEAEEAANFVAAFDHATRVALPPNDSLAFIADVADQWERQR